MNPRINEPGLIYRIFIARKGDNPLLFAQELSTQFGMEQDDEDPGLWHSTDGFAHVQLRDPEINDTMIVEYLGNAAEGVENFWCSALKQCTAACDRVLANHETDRNIELRGCSVIFQGVVGKEIDIDSLEISQLVTDCSLGDYQVGKSHPTPGGRLWLLQSPVLTRGGNRDTRYLALCHKDGENAQNQYLFDHSFNWPDLISHKAHEIAATYRYILREENLEYLIAKLTEITKTILDTSRPREDLEELLAQLALDYDQLLENSLEVNYQSISIGQQDWNFFYLLGDKPESPIFQYLGNKIRSYHQEIELKSAQVQRLLAASDQAVSIVQAKINAEKEERQKRMESWLAFLGIALAVPQLLSFDTLNTMLSEAGFILSAGWVFLIQVVVTLFIALLISWLVTMQAHRKDRRIVRSNGSKDQ